MSVKLKDDQGRDIDLLLYIRPGCGACTRVLERARQLDVELPTRDIGTDVEALATLVHVGGKRQVPCLFIDGEPLYESSDIIVFLEERLAAT